VNDVRDRPRVGDWALLALVVLVAAAYAFGAARILWEVANNRATTEVLWLPVGLVCAGTIGVQVWRRTVWGRRPND
jgi:hypothetical protein